MFFGRCSEKDARPARPVGRLPQQSRVGAHPALSVVLVVVSAGGNEALWFWGVFRTKKAKARAGILSTTPQG
jgi:hypothetical protein